jgi:hypothetical protein
MPLPLVAMTMNCRPSIAQDVTARFTEANQQAEKAYKNYKNASEHTIWWVVAISTFCALAVTILFNLLSR